MAVPLGDWLFPSGNQCSAHFQLDETGVGHIWFAWESPPPLSVEDNRFYMGVVMPKVVRLLESLNIGG